MEGIRRRFDEYLLRIWPYVHILQLVALSAASIIMQHLSDDQSSAIRGLIVLTLCGLLFARSQMEYNDSRLLSKESMLYLMAINELFTIICTNGELLTDKRITVMFVTATVAILVSREIPPDPEPKENEGLFEMLYRWWVIFWYSRPARAAPAAIEGDGVAAIGHVTDVEVDVILDRVEASESAAIEMAMRETARVEEDVAVVEEEGRAADLPSIFETVCSPSIRRRRRLSPPAPPPFRLLPIPPNSVFAVPSINTVVEKRTDVDVVDVRVDEQSTEEHAPEKAAGEEERGDVEQQIRDTERAMCRFRRVRDLIEHDGLEATLPFSAHVANLPSVTDADERMSMFLDLMRDDTVLSSLASARIPSAATRPAPFTRTRQSSGFAGEEDIVSVWGGLMCVSQQLLDYDEVREWHSVYGHVSVGDVPSALAAAVAVRAALDVGPLANAILRRTHPALHFQHIARILKEHFNIMS